MRAVLIAGAFLSVFALTTTQADDPPKAKPEAAAVKKLKEDLKVLEEQLRDQDPKVRREAGETLGQLAEAVNSTAFRLNQHFEYENEETLVAQLKAVEQMGPSVQPDLGSRVVQYCAHKNVEVRYAAVRATVRLREPLAVPALIALLKDPEVRIRRQAAAGFRFYGGHAARAAVPALVETVKNAKEDNEVRQYAASALGEMGLAANQALPTLIQTFKNKNNDAMLRGATIISIGRLAPGEKSVLTWLIELLEDKQDFRNRSFAGLAIQEMGPQAKDTVPALIVALRVETIKDPDLAKHVQYTVIRALSAIGPDAESAVPQLVGILKNKQLPFELRWNAVIALGEMGPAARGAVQALRDALLSDDEDLLIKQDAKKALAKIER